MKLFTFNLVESRIFQKFIIALIIFNAIVLGLETDPDIMIAVGAYLILLDNVILWIFVIELLLRLYAYGLKFFRDSWNIFDIVIVSVSLIPAQEAFSVLRALRTLRVLRLISAIPRLRKVIQGLIGAIPGIGSIALIMSLIFYVFSVMAVKLYGSAYPEWFGSLGNSLFSLFQIMTLEGWADMVREIMKTHPKSWIFFVVYILVATFTILNLFIAVIVESMQNEHQHQIDELSEFEREITRDLSLIKQELSNLTKLVKNK